MQTSGTDLKVERVKANVTIQDIAARMGVSRQTVWGIERSAHVSPERASQYRAALLTSDDIVSVEATA
jgi:transcriptional regulator with XRE-family HTH domain